MGQRERRVGLDRPLEDGDRGGEIRPPVEGLAFQVRLERRQRGRRDARQVDLRERFRLVREDGLQHSDRKPIDECVDRVRHSLDLGAPQATAVRQVVDVGDQPDVGTELGRRPEERVAGPRSPPHLEGVFEVDPAALGLARRSRDELRGGEPAENAAILRGVLSGERGGAARDIVLLNAAAGLVVGGAAGSLADGLAGATRAVDSGAAADLLARFCGYARGE